jgi:hypothetical protein
MESKMKICPVLIGALLVVSPAIAHDTPSLHGGRTTDAGAYHVELVVKANVVDVFIRDAGERPVGTAGFKGTAILVVGGKSERVALEPVDGRLSGQTATALPARPRGVVQLTAPDGTTAQGKFN